MPRVKTVRQRCVLDDILDDSNFSPTTRKQYEWVIGEWLAFAGYSARAWTQLRAQQFYNELIGRRGFKPQSANVCLASLRYVSKWYALKYKGEDFAVVQLKEAPSATGRRRALIEDEVIALLGTCDGTLPIVKRPIDRRDRTLITVGLETGMRRISLAGMQLENIKGNIARNVPIKGRGGKVTFDVPLSDTALLALHDWSSWLRSHDVRRGPVFVGLQRRIGARGQIQYTPGGGISLPLIYDIINSRAERAGIQHVHPHLLRNTFITWRQMAGLNALQIASITGHKTFGAEWQNMTPYLDMAMIGEIARQATPPWFAEHIQHLVRDARSAS